MNFFVGGSQWMKMIPQTVANRLFSYCGIFLCPICIDFVPLGASPCCGSPRKNTSICHAFFRVAFWDPQRLWSAIVSTACNSTRSSMFGLANTSRIYSNYTTRLQRNSDNFPPLKREEWTTDFTMLASEPHSKSLTNSTPIEMIHPFLVFEIKICCCTKAGRNERAADKLTSDGKLIYLFSGILNFGAENLSTCKARQQQSKITCFFHFSFSPWKLAIRFVFVAYQLMRFVIWNDGRTGSQQNKNSDSSAFSHPQRWNVHSANFQMVRSIFF